MSPVEIAAEVAIEQRERAISRPTFFTEKQVIRYNVAREVIAPDCEDTALGTDVGARISQNGTRRGAIRHVNDKTAVHEGGKLDRAYRLEEEFDVKFVRLEFGSQHEPAVGGHVAPNPETAMRKGEGELKLTGVPIVTHLESPSRQHLGGKR
ncbi:hypothetical protein ACFY3V_38115 [Streptosporangium sp. NPDC000095]|uniref:hypothetical protein n=1 Tax=Streptosporangium sp. NPDC000095 TaxID=3366184 RepID=UPI00367B1978